MVLSLSTLLPGLISVKRLRAYKPTCQETKTIGCFYRAGETAGARCVAHEHGSPPSFPFSPPQIDQNLLSPTSLFSPAFPAIPAVMPGFKSSRRTFTSNTLTSRAAPRRKRILGGDRWVPPFRGSILQQEGFSSCSRALVSTRGSGLRAERYQLRTDNMPHNVRGLCGCTG